jgi:hypothetical protein
MSNRCITQESSARGKASASRARRPLTASYTLVHGVVAGIDVVVRHDPASERDETT